MWIIEWTDNAEEQYINILDFWIKHNKSTSSSKKIMLDTERVENLLSKNPFIGQSIEIEFAEKNIRRMLVLKNYSIIYTVSNKVNIVSFWDNRQNPQDLPENLSL